MEPQKVTLPLGLTFDDVLLLPGYADFSRSDIDLSTQLTKRIKISLPLVSSPMDTVTESGLAIALSRAGGIGILHRNLSIEDQANEVAKVKKQGLLVGAAIGASKARPLTSEPARQSPDGSSHMADGRSDGERGFEERVEALVKAGVDVIVVDSADGYKKPILEATKYLKKSYPNLEVIAGNVATEEGAEALIEAGVDAIRVGMGPGAICTTRIISGMGVPQITAILETAKAGKKAGVPIIADGGIKYSGDITKALAAGASSVMMGSFFAQAFESPGKVVEFKKSQVPHRFQSIFSSDEDVYKFKEYRGMGSEGAMRKGVEVKSEGEFHGKSYKDRVLVAEGVEGLVPIKGTVQELIDQAVGGIRSGMYHVGAKTIPELWKKAQFIQITQASLTESHPHDILVTNPGKSYS